MAEPRLYALPPGADYARALLAGLDARLGSGPDALARTTIFVNTERMRRRLRTLLAEGPARLLPRLRLIGDLGDDPTLGHSPLPAPAAERRLGLAGAVAALLDRQPGLAPRTAVFDLADSLARLIDEMAEEGVPPEALARLDVAQHSAHWQRSLAFLDVIARHWAPDLPPGGQARRREAVAALAEGWAATPPEGPVVVAGSTGSRGTTRMLIAAVARLEQGFVVLPGFDDAMPAPAWQALADDPGSAEDHPQYRFMRILDDLGLPPGAVRPWHGDGPAEAPAPARNRLISLALRPAPVTDQWLAEGPAQAAGLAAACAGMTLIEAPGPRAEAQAIALRLRQAAEEGVTAALITPDRALARQVSAALDRWGIRPDDSAGEPLHLSPPGRLLRLLARAMETAPTGGELLALLGHPLAHAGPGRAEHLRHLRRLELEHLRGGPPQPRPEDVRVWTAGTDADAWGAWLAGWLARLAPRGPAPLADLLARHRALAEALAVGAGAEDGSGALWEGEAGEKAADALDTLTRAAPAYDPAVTPAEFTRLLDSHLSAIEVRVPVAHHPRILIWGTLEARVQAAELTILGGLNEGTWPDTPAPDPWLSRAMRAEAGLLLPERRIGLSAHDFQQAVAARRTVLSRALRDAEAPTVPARWLNRLTNLLGGLGPEGQAALQDMQARGKGLLALAEALGTPAEPVPRAGRPAPRPPVAARPRQLSVTRIQTLVRDPYAIYARSVLGLRPLDPLHVAPDAPLRGTVMHAILRRFIDETEAGLPGDARALLLRIAGEELARSAPWPAARRLWAAQLARVADWFLATEATRRATARPLVRERRGRMVLGPTGFTLTGTADRVDIRPDGALILYDYKTGRPPSNAQVQAFDRQLPLMGAMLEAGAFDGIAAAPVAGLVYIGLSGSPEERTVETGDFIAATHAGLARLLAGWSRRERGYTARARMERTAHAGDYDHLARRGEWDESDPPAPEDVG